MESTQQIAVWTLIRCVRQAAIQVALLWRGEKKPAASAPRAYITDVLHFCLCAGLFREGLHYESPRGRREDRATERAHVRAGWKHHLSSWCLFKCKDKMNHFYHLNLTFSYCALFSVCLAGTYIGVWPRGAWEVCSSRYETPAQEVSWPVSSHEVQSRHTGRHRL